MTIRTPPNIFASALAIDPSIAKTQALLGICESRLGQPSAQALLEKSFPKLKDKNLQIQAGMELANIYYQQGNLDHAASVMQSLVSISTPTMSRSCSWRSGSIPIWPTIR